MLTVDDLWLDYDGAVGLAGVSLTVDEGELVALVGANGAGKSSLLAAVSGLHRPVGGSIRFLDREIGRLPAHAVARRGISLVPEGRHLFPHLTVRENLVLGAALQKDRDKRATDLAYIYGLFPVLEERLSQQAGTLSGGEQQMVALGRALMSRPRLLMLDEPSLGVAPQAVERIFSALRRIHSEGTTVLLVEQKLDAALGLCDRAYVLQSGSVVLAGTGDELLASADVRKAYLGV
jgi:branched-chain amino acid transport system ATP-binding protein